MNFNEREYSIVHYLLKREIEECKDGWQLSGIGEVAVMEQILQKLEASKTINKEFFNRITNNLLGETNA